MAGVHSSSRRRPRRPGTPRGRPSTQAERPINDRAVTAPRRSGQRALGQPCSAFCRLIPMLKSGAWLKGLALACWGTVVSLNCIRRGPEGVAVRTSLRRLDEALKASGREWLASRMIYQDPSQEITADRNYADDSILQALGRPFLPKQREYRTENEVRLVTVDPEASAYIRVGGVLAHTLNRSRIRGAGGGCRRARSVSARRPPSLRREFRRSAERTVISPGAVRAGDS